MKSERFYPITWLHKDDLRQLFRDRRHGKLPAKIRRKIDALSDADMEYLASKLANALCDCCYWEALEAIFDAYSPFVADCVSETGRNVRKPRAVVKKKQEVRT